jgi:hypothetical protein
MNLRRLLEIGGFLAGFVLIAFGIVAIYMGVDGRSTVRDSLKQEEIFFGNAEEDEAVAEHAEQWSEDQVQTGDQARAFALVMREHTLEGSGGLTYAQMGRFQSAADPDDPAGTSDEEAAAKDETGQPISNPSRDTWVTETALTTALNMSYMAEQLSIFGIVVGVALLLAGIGFIILALVVLGGPSRKAEASVAPAG